MFVDVLMLHTGFSQNKANGGSFIEIFLEIQKQISIEMQFDSKENVSFIKILRKLSINIVKKGLSKEA